MKRLFTLLTLLFFFILLLIMTTPAIAEGSRTLAPNYGDTTSLVAPGAANNNMAWLEHDGFGGAQDNFLDPSAPADERLYIRLKAGETLRYGIRRIPVKYDQTNAYTNAALEHSNHEYLTIVVYDADGNIVQTTTLTNDNSPSHGAWLDAGQPGVIQTVASSLLGPQFTYNSTTYNSGGYTPLEYTNNDPEGDQDFYIAFIQDDGATTDIDVRSWYDLWDFSVYDGNEEKPGRLHCKRWSLTAQDFDNLLSDDCQFYVRVPSVIDGANQGNYIKQIDLGGLNPFSLVVYANAQGSDGSDGDTNGDGTADFQDYRMSLTNEVADIDYDLFINNPDLQEYPTTTLPTVKISNANFYCSASSNGGEAAITFESNQVGQVAIIVDLNGTNGYQAGTEDRIIEAEITSEGYTTIIWDGLDGLGGTVPSGTDISISGRFTAGPIHVPLWDVEENAVGINMLDVRPSTSFDLIYWDDSDIFTNANPEIELDGTNTSLHTWTSGDDDLINTWSFGYYQINTQNITFTYNCEADGDGVSDSNDGDFDNDGIPNATEGDALADTDGDGAPDYLDADLAGFVDSNGDGVNDNYDTDLDGIPNALDLDSDNDGITDLVEAGGTDSDNDGKVDGFTDISGSGSPAYSETTGCSTTFASQTGHTTGPTTDDDEITFSTPFDIDFFGTTITSGTTGTISPNGWVSFSNLTAVGNPWNAVAMPSATYTNTIFLNHQDWSPNNGGTVTYGTNGIAPNRTFVVTYTSVPFYSGSGTATVQLQILETTSEIKIVTTNFDPSNGNNNSMGLNLDGTTAYAVSNRNLQSYTITIAECRSFIWSSANGVDDNLEASPLPLPDTDGDGIADYLDLDSDNDGITDTYENDLSVDVSTGRIAFTDTDGDGLNDDFLITPTVILDTDGDSYPDYLDIDSDNDGLIDNVEGQTSSNYIASSSADTDSNGLIDVYDPANGGDLITPIDTDGDSDVDYRDTDADGDGVEDFIEGYDSNSDGISDLDTNADGVLDNTDACVAYSGAGMLLTENADFENGLKSLSSFSGDAFVTDDAQSGDAAIIVGPSVSGTSVSTFLPAEAGANYQFTGYAKIAGGPGYSAIGITFWDADQSTRLSEPQQQVLATTYTQYTVTATAPANTVYVEVWTYKDGTSGTLTFDNFTLTRTDACSGDITDDTDADGLLDIFENFNAPLQNTDGADEKDWQDDDDDNDGNLTAGEDANSNNDWSDDFTEGGNTVPDYLFSGDFDGDAIANASDTDSDNDGIPDTIEANGESIDPSGDDDADGIPNYKDASVGASLTSSADQNGDGVFDVFDTDLDGIPDFLDLDSDNDGLWDAVEAYEGSIPNGLDQTSGQFTLNDPDNDGLMNYIDSSPAAAGGSSTLANPDSDGDGYRDYVDIDSDGDGIVDLIESQSTSNLIQLTNTDTDGDGIDDAFDPDQGGVLITPINSDGLDLQDYLDDDSDNDGVLDIVEGSDSNYDGFGDWDDDQNGTTNEADFSTDSDGDGLPDAFDNVTLGTTGNSTGSNASLQNTDGLDELDFRDTDDDADGILTMNEDANSNGNLQDDQTQAAGIPDYLFNGDYDKDGILDALDSDSDNDGIADTDEDGGQSIDPSGDEDGDGIPNFRDSDDGTVLAGLTSTADINSDGVYDVYDTDLDGIPDFRDADSDNDGIPDLVEVGGVDTDGNGMIDGLDDSDWDTIPDNVDVDNTGGADSDSDGIDDAFDFSVSGGTDTDGDDIIDSADTDIDGDGLPNTYDPDNGGTALTPLDTDGDGINDQVDLDTDNDGIPDLVEAGGTDTDGDGKVDNTTDTDNDGLADLVDTDNGGTALAYPDSDYDGYADLKDIDSDNDGITDAIENGVSDTNSDGLIDSYATDTDGDGLADAVDPDNGGSAITSRDTDGDGLDDYLDLDSDNDGYPDIIEGGGTDSDFDGIVDNLLDIDQDGIPANVDVDQTGGTDADSDGIDDLYDVSYTLGNDNDNDGIDDSYDFDKDGNGFSDAVESFPYDLLDSDNDGIKDFRDLDSDNDGIVDVIEFGLTADSGTGGIASFTDSDNDGFNDTQDGYIGTSVNASVTPITPLNTDSGSEPVSAVIPDYLDLDSDNDGIVDIREAQTKSSYIALSGVDSNLNGLDDAFDPNVGATLITPVNTDGTGSEDYLDTDADDDGVLDRIEGHNSDKNLYADWDANQNGNFDDTGFDTDTDEDGLLDIYDNVSSKGNSNVTGSTAAVQDTDLDGTWDFQDVDDDNDGINTDSEATTANDDPNGIIPDYLFGDPDTDGDGVADAYDLDQDNDGLANASEDGGVGIDPSADTDGDGLYNYQDSDIDGDGTSNKADTNTSGVNTTGFTDINSDGVIDQFDQDYDGIPDFRDRDSDNDGIADILEIGLTDANEDGSLDEGGGLTDANGNGLDDSYDDACDGSTVYASSFTNNGGTNPANATGNTPTTFAQVANGNDITFDLGVVMPTGSTVVLSLNDGAAGINATANITQSFNGTTFSNLQLYSATTGVGSGTGPETFSYVLTSYARYINVEEESGTNRPVNIHTLSYVVPCTGGTAASAPDTDSDGLEDYLDLDADADGIPDNIEAQLSASYVAPAAGDTDGDGILDVYDEDISAGNALDPIDSDGDTTPDYQDTDSDDDGIDDVVEAWDSDLDGFGDWDTDGDNDPTDETGYLADNDSDGISYLFDNTTSVTNITNISGSSAVLSDTDEDNLYDFRDDDDDGDGTLTSAEDANSNMNWTDDFTQGGGIVPDYLYSPDFDGDGIINENDLDADNDGLLNVDEVVNSIYAPLSDLDQDNIYNYLDSDLPGFTDTNSDGIDDRYDQDKDGIPNFLDLDSDNDGIADIVEAGLPDVDGDGMIDSFDDSGDNNGLDDDIILGTSVAAGPSSAISGGTGVDDPALAVGLPDGSGTRFNSLNTDIVTLDYGTTLTSGTVVAVSMEIRSDASSKTLTVSQSTSETGPYSNPQDFTLDTYLTVENIFYYQLNADARYLELVLTARTAGQIRVDGTYHNSTSPIDTDGDNLPNFLDLDSDGDGITDNREAQTTAAYVAITSADTDGDGWKDVYDADNGGIAITPTDTDGDTTPDYLDTDSDDDNVPDIIEGFDANKNGFSDLDLDQDGDLSDETNYGLDQDGDGLEKLFDSFSGSGVNNILGSKASLQDTDGDGVLDWRDEDDDTDGILTTGEDANSDSFYYNDKTQGGGATPDYLYANDTDDDGIIDGVDPDSDNDGITDADEFNGATYAGANDPFDDDDGDGVLNYRDSDAANFVDVNSDGIDDRVDADRDGIPNFFDLDSDNDGIPDSTEGNGGTDPGLSGLDTDGDGLDNTVDTDDGGTPLTVPDTDSDGIPDYLDLDSDNDGLTDLLEAGGNDYNGDGKLDSFGDTDGDGLGNSVDSDNGGSALANPDTDSDGISNYVDSNSDNDLTPDYQEAYYEAGPTNYEDSYINRVTAYNAANSTSGFALYPTNDLSPANGVPDYLDDSDGDGTLNLFDADSPYFIDEDGDGLINLFDPDQNGNFYAQVSGTPDRDSDGIVNYLDSDDVPLPLDFLDIQARELYGNVSIEWQTTNEINVSHFEVEHSLDGRSFNVIGNTDAVNEKDAINSYSFSHNKAIKGYNYYRVKEVDFDGYFEYSKMVYVVKEQDGISWTVYPNPATDQINLRSNIIIPEAKLSIIDMGGRTMYQNVLRFGNQEQSIDVSEMSSGVYQVIIELPDTKQQFQLIIK
ncbi:T9SS type A sorting domain-containing protein [Marinoscillum sp.]|uniref:T9SS type A sorting domain-containing protein n=1 Tax=Marinoscillum sp. TaxID=2024838 RepID=UPI003BAAC656